MFDRPPLLEEPFAQTLSGKTENSGKPPETISFQKEINVSDRFLRKRSPHLQSSDVSCINASVGFDKSCSKRPLILPWDPE